MKNFLKDLEKESEKCLNSFDDRIKGTVEAINDSLMSPKSKQGVPVETGWLKSNYVITVDQEYLDVAGSRENPDDSLQESKHREFLTKEKLYLSKNIYLNNNVYYGPYVNYGVGQKAQLFREKAIQDGNEYLKVNRK